MTLLAILITVVAGVAMGWINNVAGGAGMFALWAFRYACGLPLEIANPTARVAAVAIGLFSFLGYMRAGQRAPLRAWLHGLLAIPGAVLGSRLALLLPPIAFRVYLASVMVMLLWQLRRPAPAQAAAGQPQWLTVLACLLIGLHMGYSQVGTGLVITLVLAAAYRRDLVALNAGKSAIVIATSCSSVTTFWAAHAIAWVPGAVLAAGAAFGSYIASHWAVRKGSEGVRRVVIAIALLTLVEQTISVVLDACSQKHSG